MLRDSMLAPLGYLHVSQPVLFFPANYTTSTTMVAYLVVCARSPPWYRWNTVARPMAPPLPTSCSRETRRWASPCHRNILGVAGFANGDEFPRPLGLQKIARGALLELEEETFIQRLHPRLVENLAGEKSENYVAE